ncbi:lysophospholipid acyltransferase family protein [Carboxylicivirga sp. M1479]|uniref:lysophospholipid acyltransferase family protein n=1 Tax=Carboxylicivirga sp. M1479 TaxID=2594476 RepID=UPI0021062C2B|nr:hypothetical protein [Carboxylicivirga sp. M1479]
MFSGKFLMMKLFTTAIFLFFVGLVSVMPFRLLYWFSNFASLIMGRVVKYRRKVIIDNLEKSFPQKSAEEINKITNAFYRNLTDNLLESFKSFTMKQSSIIKRHHILNPELLDEILKEHKGIIGLTAHYANWEWGSQSGSLQCNNQFAALYKPLRNKYTNSILKKSRMKCGTELVSIYETSAMFEKYENSGYVFLMAADQGPAGGKQMENAIWLDFYNRNTAFLNGPEKYAVKYNYPIVYIDIQRVKRGYYEIKLSLLTDTPRSLPKGKITEMYRDKLVEIIDAKPQDWLWSHKRWKRSPKQ